MTRVRALKRGGVVNLWAGGGALAPTLTHCQSHRLLIPDKQKKRRPELLLERGLELNLNWGGKKTAALRASESPGVVVNCYAVDAGGDVDELQETLAVITSLLVISDMT